MFKFWLPTLTRHTALKSLALSVGHAASMTVNLLVAKPEGNRPPVRPIHWWEGVD
jgi:hypothetical protein